VYPIEMGCKGFKTPEDQSTRWFSIKIN
jgi:hypothetical protein